MGRKKERKRRRGKKKYKEKRKTELNKKRYEVEVIGSSKSVLEVVQQYVPANIGNWNIPTFAVASEEEGERG